MSKRVHELAKELGVTSKVVLEKCWAEGIDKNTLKAHQSKVGAGLEATIREWFSEHAQGESVTAVETAQKVDLETIRTKAKRKATPMVAGEAEEPTTPDAGESAVAVAEAPVPPEAGIAVPEAPTEEAQPVARAPEPTAPDEATAADAVGDAEPPVVGDTEPQSKTARVIPAPMNVPERPKVVTPAGPKLTTQSPVKLSGPKVVRIEAPERLEPPRPRRPAAYGPKSPMGGDPTSGPPTAGDRGRSPRRGGGGKRDTGPARRRGVTSDQKGRGGAGAWRQQDLIEREARLQRSGGFLKKRRQEMKNKSASASRPALPVDTGGVVKIQAPFTIKDLSSATGVKGAEIVKKLFLQGIMASINSGIDPERAQEIMMDYEIELDVTEARSAEQVVSEEFEERQVIDEHPRGPVITILGHVDHGKTSLLDKIRHARVAEGEAGGITQATSAFKVPIEIAGESREIVFLDTPGHEAFTAMRARGANMTDIVVLVVAADDGVMPQTIESINHSKAAGVPIVVALNKIDKPEATEGNIQKILGQLAEHELNPVEWGGQTEVIRTNAITGDGITDLLEVLDYQAQLLDLKADFAGTARGTVIEARLVEGRGPTASVLVQDGNLKVGNFIVVGRAFGRVRDITDDQGKRVKETLPPSPVQISGIDQLPDAGDRFYIVDSLRKAQEAAEHRRDRDRSEHLAQPKVTLDSLFSQMDESDVKEILIVLKTDVQGSMDVIKAEIERLSTTEVKVRVLHSAVGGITESDVLLADASQAVIIGFNVIASSKARKLAEQKNVEIRTYQVIYDITEDVKRAAEGLLEPELRQEVLGHAEVRQVFKVSKVGTIAGCYVTDGVVQRDALIRVTRADVVIENDRVLEQLKRFKDDAKDVRSGMECGMKIVGYDDIKVGDVLECYKQVEVKRTI